MSVDPDSEEEEAQMTPDEGHAVAAVASAGVMGYLQGAGSLDTAMAALPDVGLPKEGMMGLVAWGAGRYLKNQRISRAATGLLSVGVYRLFFGLATPSASTKPEQPPRASPPLSPAPNPPSGSLPVLPLPPLLSPTEEQTRSALRTLGTELKGALGSSVWSASSKATLRQVESLLATGSAGEAPALTLLRQLPDSERAAYADKVARASFRFGHGKAKPYAIGIWEYAHFGGTSAGGLPEAQGHMGVPRTGVMDDTTLAAVRRLTGYEIWPRLLV